jgi:CheY-like chemotaxis protein
MNIVVVEDIRLHQKVIKKVIQLALPRAEISLCSDAFEAFALLSSLSKVDLIMVDIHMPYCKGDELIKKLRTMMRFDECRIAIMTADEDLSTSFEEIGANYFFTKPFNPKKLKIMLQSLGLSEKS